MAKAKAKAKAKTKKVIKEFTVTEMNQPSAAACAAFNVWINKTAAELFETGKPSATYELASKAS